MKKITNILFYCFLIIGVLYFLKRKFIVPNVERDTLVFVDVINQNPVDINQLKDKVVLVNFWQTWCGPCIQEMPSLNEMAIKWDALEIYCVSDEPFNKLLPFATKYANIHFVQTVDIASYGVTQYPTTYIYNKQGTRVFSKIGSKDWADDNFIATLKKNWN